MRKFMNHLVFLFGSGLSTLVLQTVKVLQMLVFTQLLDPNELINQRRFHLFSLLFKNDNT